MTLLAAPTPAPNEGPLTPTPSESPLSPAPGAAPLPDITGTQMLWLIGVLTVLVVLLWFVPLIYDTVQANRWRKDGQKKLLESLIEGAKGREARLSVEEVRQLVSAIDHSPRGASGLTSSLIALLVVTLVGVSMLITLTSTGVPAEELRQTIVTSLLSVLATIAGFYFGARTAQSSTEQATRPPEARLEPAPGGPNSNEAGRAVERGSPTSSGTASDPRSTA